MNSITELQNLVYNLTSIRKSIQEFTDRLDLLKIEKDLIQSNLINYMKDNNLKSWKTNDNTFSLISKYDVQILDESKLMDELNIRNLNWYIITKIDSTRFKQLANSLLKETWELFHWTTTTLTEYISVRKN